MSTQVKAHIGTEAYLMQITAGTHTIIADEPISKGGKDKGFNPYELLASALASCTSATIKMFAERRKWDLQEVIVKVTLESPKEPGKTVMNKQIELIGNLDDAQKETLHKIAHACPVQKVLTGEVEINATLESN